MKNYIKKLFSTIFGKILIVIVILAIGFIGGMEYKAYQIRSVLSNVFSGVSDESVKEKENKKPEIINNDLNKKVLFDVTDKGFSSVDYQDNIEFTFKFTNTTSKDITGIKGVITFSDFFGDPINTVKLSYDEGIKAGESKLYRASVDYNQFIDEDVKLRQTDLSKLKYRFDLSTIIYSDGTQESI